MTSIYTLAHLLGLKGYKLAQSTYFKRGKLTEGSLSQHQLGGGNNISSFSSVNGSFNDADQHGHPITSKVDSSVSEATIGSSSSLLAGNDKFFSETIASSGSGYSFGVGVGANFRFPPKVRMFGCYSFDGELLQFLANDCINNLYNGIMLANNRRITGADCRHR